MRGTAVLDVARPPHLMRPEIAEGVIRQSGINDGVSQFDLCNPGSSSRPKFVIVTQIIDQRLQSANLAENGLGGGEGCAQSEANSTFHRPRDQHSASEIAAEPECLEIASQSIVPASRDTASLPCQRADRQTGPSPA